MSDENTDDLGCKICSTVSEAKDGLKCIQVLGLDLVGIHLSGTFDEKSAGETVELDEVVKSSDVEKWGYNTLHLEDGRKLKPGSVAEVKEELEDIPGVNPDDVDESEIDTGEISLTFQV